MEQVNLNNKKEKSVCDKVALSESSMAKISVWLGQLESWQDVVKISGSDLVNFILNKFPDALSKNDSRELIRSLFEKADKPKIRKKRVSSKAAVNPTEQAISD